MTGQRISWGIFSRHLQWVCTQEESKRDPYGVGLKLGDAALEAGYEHVDLTLRSGGLVEPGTASKHLAAMVKGIRESGAECVRVTTSITPPNNGLDDAWWKNQQVDAVYSSASDCGIRYCRIGATSYENTGFGDDIRNQLDRMKVNAERIAKLGERCGIVSAYHTWNRSGKLDISTPVWDIVYVLKDLGKHIGLNYDIGHLISNGPQPMWEINMRHAMPHINCLSLTDVFCTYDRAQRSWGIDFVKAGEGMVEWRDFFNLAQAGEFSGPAFVQMEYMTTGAKGRPLNLNTTFWADHEEFLNENATPELMGSALKGESDYYKSVASEIFN